MSEPSSVSKHDLSCAADNSAHPSHAHKAGCPACNPTKTVPELNAAAAALLTSNEKSLLERLRDEYVEQSARCGEEDSQERSLLAQEAADEVERLQKSLQANITVSKARDANVQRLRAALKRAIPFIPGEPDGGRGSDFYRLCVSLTSDDSSAPETRVRPASDIRCRHSKYLTEPCVACEQLSSEGGERIICLGEDGVLTRLTYDPSPVKTPRDPET